MLEMGLRALRLGHSAGVLNAPAAHAAQAVSDGIMTVAQSGNGTSSGWQTAVITAISAAGSIVSLIAKNATSSSAKSALLTAGGIVGLLTNIVGSASGLITPQVGAFSVCADPDPQAPR